MIKILTNTVSAMFEASIHFIQAGLTLMGKRDELPKKGCHCKSQYMCCKDLEEDDQD